MKLDQKLVDRFYEAARFLKKRVEEDGWVWSTGFLREYVRAKYRMRFDSGLVPAIEDEVCRQHPRMNDVIVRRERKKSAKAA
jgi:hypothetical protein